MAVPGLDTRAVLDHLSPNGGKGGEMSGIDLEAFHQVRRQMRGIAMNRVKKAVGLESHGREG